MQIDSELLIRLRENAPQLDQSEEWPEKQFQLLAEAGILGWTIPRAYGGTEVSSIELIQGYEQLSAACLNTAFILTQRTGACQRIAGSENVLVKQELLPGLARGDLFATVGISHLTTSRQHLRVPAVKIETRSGELLLNGNIPWVTGAAHADFIVTGGICEDGRQMLIVLPTNVPGVSVEPAARLMALTASRTASVGLDNVVIPDSHRLAGPVHEVMKQGIGGGTGSQTTSTLAIGVASRTLTLLRKQAILRPELCEYVSSFERELVELRRDRDRSMSPAAADGTPTVSEIRQRANSLVLRITQAGMAICKGAGFVRGHEAEIAVREAMFFLVWSCPQPVLNSMVAEFSCYDNDGEATLNPDAP